MSTASKGWHINDEGVTGKCSATVKECRFGKHFETDEIAKAVAQDRMDQQFGTFAVAKKDTPEIIRDRTMENIERAFAARRGEALDDKDAVLDALVQDREKIKANIESASDKILWDENMSVSKRRAALKELITFNRAYNMSEDAIQVLGDPDGSSLPHDIKSDQYDKLGVREVSKDQVAKDREAIEKHFKTFSHQFGYFATEEDKDAAEDTFVDNIMKDSKKLAEMRKWAETTDDEGNTIYRGADVVDDEVSYDGVLYTRIEEGETWADVPDGFRIQVNRELTPDEANKLAGAFGYAYAKTGGERGNGFHQDSPNSIVFGADTTKGRAYNHIDSTFFDDAKDLINNGSPKRKTDRAGVGTKGSSLVEGLGKDLKIEFYVDSVWRNEN